MITAVKNLTDRWQLKKDLMDFLNEMEKNLETYYVMDQRQFITQCFSTTVWDRVKSRDMVRKHEAIVVGVRVLEGFNRLFKEYKEFEQWYAVDMANKTKENATKLHGMKQGLDALLKSMEALIIPAGQALEREMVEMGYLKQ